MEQLCSDIIENISLNHENEILKDISEGLSIFVNRSVNEMTRRFPDFKFKCVTPCGSMAERTRIRGDHGLEYDYIIEMESWPNCGKLEFQPTCKGSMQPLYTVDNDNMVCLKTAVITTFLYNLYKSVKAGCKENFCPKFAFKEDSREKFQPFIRGKTILPSSADNTPVGCRKCSVYMANGCLEFYKFHKQFQFKWFPKNKETYLNILRKKGPPFQSVVQDSGIVLVDIHPVLIVTPEQVLPNHSEIERSSGPDIYCYLFPNNDTAHNVCCNEGTSCWRISHYNTELQILQKTCQVHRNMFMILKFIREEMFNEKLSRMQAIRSYEVKTAALNHIKNCNASERDLVECLANAVKYLSECFNGHHLTQINSGANILECVSAFNLRNSTSYEIIGLIFEALYKLITTCKCAKTEDLMKDFSMIQGEVHTALWKAKHPNQKYEHVLFDLKKTTSAQKQACQEALKKYVDERTSKTATSVLYKYQMKFSRLKRLGAIQSMDERKKRKIEKEIIDLSFDPEILFDNREVQCLPIILKGCYI